MNDYKIVGKSKPNKIRLRSYLQNKIIEIPTKAARRLYEQGLIRILNPDTLYTKI